MTSHELSPTLDKGAGDGPRRNQDAAYVAVPGAARCLTTSNQRIDSETETFIPTTANTLKAQAGKGGSGIGPEHNFAVAAQGVRRLTPTECERLQGFPDGWTALPGAPDSRRYAAMGDAVTVPVSRWIGERLGRYAA